MLTADAGMGKTRLLGDFARSREVPLVGARPGDERVPYALLARLLRTALGPGAGTATSLDGQLRSELARVLPELGAAPPELMNEARFRQAVVQSLAARHTAGLTGLTLDDLHFADSASLELLPALLTSGLRFALAVRGAEMPTALDAWQRAETGQALIEVALPPLTEADVRQLLDTLALEGVDAAALAGPLARHTGGNPYFVLETLGAIVTQPDATRRRPADRAFRRCLDRAQAGSAQPGGAEAGAGRRAGGGRFQRGAGGARAAVASARPDRGLD